MAQRVVDFGLLDPATGDAGDYVGDIAYVHAMVHAESALLDVLADAGYVKRPPRTVGTPDSWFHPGSLDPAAIAAESRGGGNPVIPMLKQLRAQVVPSAADGLHFGATSQDILDTASMLVARRVIEKVEYHVVPAIAGLASLAGTYRTTTVAGRTLGQHAAPTTFGLRVAVLLDGVTRAANILNRVELPAQLGGSVGTLAVLVDALGTERTQTLRRDFAAALDLDFREGIWHVERSVVTELAAALGVLIGALGRLGLEVAQLARTEVGEIDVVQGDGDGGSSAMPQKRNPVAAVLLVANGRRSPALVSTVFASMLTLDDRPGGDWHAEWQPLRELMRLAVESAVLAEQAVESLRVNADRMRENIDLSHGAVHAERAQWALVPFVGRARAAALIKEALGTAAHSSVEDGGFVDALLELLRHDRQVDAAAVDRVREVTRVDLSIGLSDWIIDTAIAASEGAMQ